MPSTGYGKIGEITGEAAGCILVGKSDAVGMVTNSKYWFLQLYNKMYAAHKRGEKIDIVIK